MVTAGKVSSVTGCFKVEVIVVVGLMRQSLHKQKGHCTANIFWHDMILQKGFVNVDPGKGQSRNDDSEPEDALAPIPGRGEIRKAVNRGAVTVFLGMMSNGAFETIGGG